MDKIVKPEHRRHYADTMPPLDTVESALVFYASHAERQRFHPCNPTFARHDADGKALGCVLHLKRHIWTIVWEDGEITAFPFGTGGWHDSMERVQETLMRSEREPWDTTS